MKINYETTRSNFAPPKINSSQITMKIEGLVKFGYTVGDVMFVDLLKKNKENSK